MKRIPPKPGQESVWDYPRPPRLEAVPQSIRVIFADIVIVQTSHAMRVLETSHPPVYYIPQADIQMQYLRKVPQKSSFCEWKGVAQYWDLAVGGKESLLAAWSYAEPRDRFAGLADHLAFYVQKIDAGYVGETRVHPQAGDFYGGWITPNIVGPFKGEPGTWGW